MPHFRSVRSARCLGCAGSKTALASFVAEKPVAAVVDGTTPLQSIPPLLVIRMLSLPRTSSTMTETPRPYRRSSWRFETPSPPSPSAQEAPGSIMDVLPGTTDDLVGVLEQVSALTMNDAAFAGPKLDNLRTPVSLDPMAVKDEASKRKLRPHFLEVRKKSRPGLASAAPSKLFSAPPLPSSPDLSAGGDVRRLPPQFSPVGNSHTIDLGSILYRHHSADPGDAVHGHLPSPPSGHFLPPTAPPPTPQVAASLPPPMPWFETPEQAPRRKIALSQTLPMKKGSCLFPENPVL